MVLVKNESYFLPYVLKQCEGIFDSFVIYDIESSDNTRDIIKWFVERNENKADIFVRYMPHVAPEVQGAFRNSMIAEGQRDCYLILDGDELYKPKDITRIPEAANELLELNKMNYKTRFGVFKRIEMNKELTMQYNKRRSHHRLYTRDAFWTGTHPGEVSGYKQNEESEKWFDIHVYHFHNATRSPKEEDALSRISRKRKRTYHPGELIDLDLLKELPILRTRIEDFPVSPALEALWG
jgi:hypothetical protein